MKAIAWATAPSAFVFARSRVVVRRCVLAAASKFPRTLCHDEEKILAFASRFCAAETFAVPFVYFLAASTQAPRLAPDGNA
jgi:hypothetical protein